jgi:putative PIN family toxin of toxin-antitoxin system
MRAVLDVNVLISAVLSSRGAPGRLLAAWRNGAFELVVSPLLLAELGRALAYPKLARLVSAADADALVALLARAAEVAADPPGPPPLRSADPNDDYLVALAAAERAVIVSGDAHLTALAGRIPVRRPAEFLAEVDGGGG